MHNRISPTIGEEAGVNDFWQQSTGCLHESTYKREATIRSGKESARSGKDFANPLNSNRYLSHPVEHFECCIVAPPYKDQVNLHLIAGGTHHTQLNQVKSMESPSRDSAERSKDAEA
jgi:hypothetical protein